MKNLLGKQCYQKSVCPTSELLALCCCLMLIKTSFNQTQKSSHKKKKRMWVERILPKVHQHLDITIPHSQDNKSLRNRI